MSDFILMGGCAFLVGVYVGVRMSAWVIGGWLKDAGIPAMLASGVHPSSIYMRIGRTVAEKLAMPVER